MCFQAIDTTFVSAAPPKLTLHFDSLGSTHAQGWAFATSGSALASIEVWEGDTPLAIAPVCEARPDVGAAHGDQYSMSGFRIRYSPYAQKVAHLDFRARTVAGETLRIGNISVLTPTVRELAHSQTLELRHPSPFPRAVAKLLCAISPGFDDQLSPDGELAAVDTLVGLLKSDNNGIIPQLVHYARFVRDVWHHMEGVARLFPEHNAYAEPGAKDASCRTNSPDQMIAVAHQLYVAKAAGLEGAFAEFGCFKGFSTAMLSVACARLGVPMHVFDSFEGLPPSDDPYYNAGEFKGSLDEVRRNVAMYGDDTVVRYHQGFFADSLKKIEIPKLLQIWMDVDLYSSARDMAPAFAALDQAGAVFSHECESSMYLAGHAVEDMPTAPGNVQPAVLANMKMNGAVRIRGAFLSGNTGCFWRDGGLPVLSHAALMRFVHAIR